MVQVFTLAALAYNAFNSNNLGNYSSYELVFGRKLKLRFGLRDRSRHQRYQELMKITTHC